MKLLIGIAFFVTVASATPTENTTPATNKEECSAAKFCSTGGKITDLEYCNAKLEHFHDTSLNEHLNQQLTASFDYLILASHYNTYARNRPGFHKVFQSLSDKAWDNVISLIKHITKRGGKVQDIAIKENSVNSDVNEVEAMGLALNIEKRLANHVQKVHRREEHRASDHDPHTGHYLEDHFLDTQTETIIKLAGYTNDLAKFALSKDTSLGFFIFDEYLQKQ